MVLKLNATREAYKAFPKNGTAPNIEQMPLLIADGRVPMNVAQLMQRRLDVRNVEADVRSSYIDNYFDIGDAVLYHPDGRVKIVFDSQTLREITPKSPRSNGALILTEDTYKTAEGVEFKKGKLGKTENSLSAKDVKAHPVWKVLAREDQALLDDYVDFVFAEGKQKFGYDSAMGVYLDSAGDAPKLRAWGVGGLEYWSDAYGRCSLDVGNGRFVGIAPEALSALGKGASNIQTYTMEDLRSFDSAVKGLEGILHPDVLKSFVELRKKL